jgi:hypothetical protein
MSWRLFGQIVLLILIYWALDWAWVCYRDSRLQAASAAQMAEIQRASDNRIREIQRGGLPDVSNNVEQLPPDPLTVNSIR